MRVFEVSVTYLLREGSSGTEVLLGEKLTGLGIGKFVGPGGKLEQGETAVDAAIRETAEEIGVRIRAEDLIPIARLRYDFPYRPAWSQAQSTFLVRRWAGDPVASSELAPRWFPLREMPFDHMWADAAIWLPGALAGEYVDADCSYAEDNDSVATFRQTRGSTGRMP